MFSAHLSSAHLCVRHTKFTQTIPLWPGRLPCFQWWLVFSLLFFSFSFLPQFFFPFFLPSIQKCCVLSKRLGASVWLRVQLKAVESIRLKKRKRRRRRRRNHGGKVKRKVSNAVLVDRRLFFFFFAFFPKGHTSCCLAGYRLKLFDFLLRRDFFFPPISLHLSLSFTALRLLKRRWRCVTRINKSFYFPHISQKK